MKKVKLLPFTGKAVLGKRGSSFCGNRKQTVLPGRFHAAQEPHAPPPSPRPTGPQIGGGRRDSLLPGVGRLYRGARSEARSVRAVGIFVGGNNLEWRVLSSETPNSPILLRNFGYNVRLPGALKEP